MQAESAPCAAHEPMSVMPSEPGAHGAASPLLQMVADTSLPVFALMIVSDAGSFVSPTVEFVGNVGVTARPVPACAAVTWTHASARRSAVAAAARAPSERRRRCGEIVRDARSCMGEGFLG